MDIAEKCVNTVRIMARKSFKKQIRAPWSNDAVCNRPRTLRARNDVFGIDSKLAESRRLFYRTVTLRVAVHHAAPGTKGRMDDLQNFRQLNGVTAGHPENHLLDAVEVSTGP